MLSLLCNGVTVQAKDISQFEAIRDKHEIVVFRQRMSQVQALMTEQNINSMSPVVEHVVAAGAILANTAELRTSTSFEQTAQDIDSISSVMEFLENVLPGAIPADSSEMVD
jgi:hypothetical protein